MTNKAFFVAWLCTFRLQSYVLLYCHKQTGKKVVLMSFCASEGDEDAINRIIKKVQILI